MPDTLTDAEIAEQLAAEDRAERAALLQQVNQALERTASAVPGDPG